MGIVYYTYNQDPNLYSIGNSSYPYSRVEGFRSGLKSNNEPCSSRVVIAKGWHCRSIVCWTGWFSPWLGRLVLLPTRTSSRVSIPSIPVAAVPVMLYYVCPQGPYVLPLRNWIPIDTLLWFGDLIP